MPVDVNHLKRLIAGVNAGGPNSQAQLVAYLQANGTNATLNNAATYTDEQGQQVQIGVHSNGRDLVKAITVSRLNPNNHSNLHQ